VSSVGAPDIHRAFPTSYAELTAALLLVPGVLGLLLEPPLYLLADRWPRRWFIAGGTAAMAVGFALCATARDGYGASRSRTQPASARR
jgi:MFS family permease